ncbi:MAG: ATP-binding cassette domain-containing protein [Acidobacteriia bacterium]|nr:ATP-binding cassette domain-containing protein [Terriglobia bacterium]
MAVKLEAQDIRLEYYQPRTDTRLVALDRVNLAVMDGEFVSIVGPSGCGKTTFLSVVDGLIAATSGRVRVNLARALVMDPKVLLMDEPFAALDAQTREVMQEELLQIWLQARKTVLFITHQIDEAIFLSDRVVVFSGRPGRVKEIIEVDIARPRKLLVKREPRFHAIEDRIWELIEEDVKSRIAGTPNSEISQD